MSELDDKSREASGEEEAGGPIGGERLADARRELQIPLVEIAKELHLDEYKVRALEVNDFDVIGAPVFAKGHLRKYAQLVKVSEADVMADYYQLTRATAMPPVVGTRTRPKKEISPGPWIMGLVALALAATAYWWFVERPAPVEPPASGTIAPFPAAEEPAIDDGAADEDSVSTDDTAVTEPESAVIAGPVVTEAVGTPVAEPPVADDSKITLRIVYSGDCWTEITDAMGRRLFFDLGKAGRTVNLSGEAPFNVLFGNAENVTLAVDGAAYDFSASDRRGRTARLTITGS